jgi:hypothetical protein
VVILITIKHEQLEYVLSERYMNHGEVDSASLYFVVLFRQKYPFYGKLDPEKTGRLESEEVLKLEILLSREIGSS